MQSPPQIVSSAFLNIKEFAKHKALKSNTKSFLLVHISCFLKMWPLGKMTEQSVLGKEWLSQHLIEGQEDTAQKCGKCCVGHFPIHPEIVTPGFLFTLLLLSKYTCKSGQLSNQSNRWK